MNNRGELLGPGYWRAFLRRNGHLLIHMEEEKKDGGDAGTGADAISGAVTEPQLPVVPPPAVVTAAPPPDIARLHVHNFDAADASAQTQLGVGVGMRETIVDASVAVNDASRVNIGRFALGENWYSGMHTNSAS